MKGYKVFNSDWTCRGFQYEVGKTYKHEGKIGLCEAGFHFCKNLLNCFNYYPFNAANKVAEIEAIGEVIENERKCVTDEIVITKELSWYEVLDLANTGKGNTGCKNTGDYNTGDHNTGDYNTGKGNTGCKNTGDYNAGHYNTGDYNTGCYNVGDYNTGGYNTGDYNTGYYNTGNWNTTNFSTGFFNSVEQPAYAFNKPLKISAIDFNNSPGVINIYDNYKNVLWISETDMTNEEKEAHPDYKTTGGYNKVLSYKEAWNHCWNGLSDEEKEEVKNIPNFDPIVFEEITGIDVNE